MEILYIIQEVSSNEIIINFIYKETTKAYRCIYDAFKAYFKTADKDINKTYAVYCARMYSADILSVEYQDYVYGEVEVHDCTFGYLESYKFQEVNYEFSTSI